MLLNRLDHEMLLPAAVKQQRYSGNLQSAPCQKQMAITYAV
jgi:hypothetical protein